MYCGNGLIGILWLLVPCIQLQLVNQLQPFLDGKDIATVMPAIATSDDIAEVPSVIYALLTGE